MSDNINTDITVKKISKSEYIKSVFSKMYGKEITEEEYDKIFSSIPPMMNPDSIEYMILKNENELKTSLTLLSDEYESRVHKYGKVEELLYISDSSITIGKISKKRYYDNSLRKMCNEKINIEPKIDKNISNLVFLIKEYQYDNMYPENQETKFILYFYNKNYKSIRMESVK